MSNPCAKGKELLRDLQRSDWLPPFDEEAFRAILSEMDSSAVQLKDAMNKWIREEGRASEVAVKYYEACTLRNGRILHSYSQHRLDKIRGLRWETGPVLPENLQRGTLSTNEVSYFNRYSDLITEYCDNIDFNLTSNIQVTQSLLICSVFII